MFSVKKRLQTCRYWNGSKKCYSEESLYEELKKGKI